MAAARSTCLYYQKMGNMSRKQITERSLSEDQIVNLRTQVRDPPQMYETHDEEAENAHMRHLRREDHTIQRWAAESENAHSRPLHRADQTAQRLVADAENITHSWRLRREVRTARCRAAVTKASCQITPAAPAQAPPIASRVTRSEGKASAEGLLTSAATGDPFTYAEAMESPRRDLWKRAMEEESTLILLNKTFSAVNSREAQQLQVKPNGSKWV